MTESRTAAAISSAAVPNDGGSNLPRRRRAVTLRTKLIASMVAMVLLVCGGAGLATGLYLQHYLVSQVDSRLAESINHGDPDGGPGNGPGSLAFPDSSLCGTTGSAAAPPWANRPGSDDSLTASISGGTVVYADVITGFAECEPLTVAQQASLQNAVAGQSAGRNVTVDLGSAGQYRVATRASGSGQVQVTGLSLDRVSQTLSRLAWTLVIVIGAALLVATAVVFLIVRRSLRPLDRVAATARAVSTMP